LLNFVEGESDLVLKKSTKSPKKSSPVKSPKKQSPVKSPGKKSKANDENYSPTKSIDSIIVSDVYKSPSKECTKVNMFLSPSKQTSSLTGQSQKRLS
jgi:hypothetical protein